MTAAHPFAAAVRAVRPLCLAGPLLAALVLAGCVALQEPAPAVQSTPVDPQWRTDLLAEHLRVLNGSDVGSRATGTAGYAIAAAYVDARLREFGLHPTRPGQHRLVYQTPIVRPLAVSMRAVAGDTVTYEVGQDVLPDARSATVRALFQEVVTGRAAAAWALGRAVLVPAEPTWSRLQRLEAAGAAAVLVVDTLRGRPAARQLDRLAVARITPEVAVHLTGLAPATLARALADSAATIRTLRRVVDLRVANDFEPRAGAVNVVAYVPGGHPTLAREAVLFCADLDAAEAVRGVDVLDLERLGAGTAAVLELARVYAALSSYWTVPERTLILAVWSGSLIGSAGLRAFLEQPTWSLDRIRAVVYVGLQAEQEAEVRALLAEYGLTLYAVPAPPAAAVRRQVLTPTPPRRPGASVTPAPPAISVADAVRAQTDVARRLAEAAYPIVLSESMGDDVLVPLVGDSLRLPPPLPQGDD